MRVRIKSNKIPKRKPTNFFTNNADLLKKKDEKLFFYHKYNTRSECRMGQVEMEQSSEIHTKRLKSKFLFEKLYTKKYGGTGRKKRRNSNNIGNGMCTLLHTYIIVTLFLFEIYSA